VPIHYRRSIMAARSQNKENQAQDTAKDSAALDAVKTVHQAEADAERREADAKAQQVERSPQDGTPAEHDSPKRHGDKMEHAARASAGQAEKG
jgi:hypothetical protein